MSRNRIGILGIVALIAIMAVVTACAAPAQPTPTPAPPVVEEPVVEEPEEPVVEEPEEPVVEEPEEPVVEEVVFNESPLLAAMVQRGELPPVAERLPKEPKVIEPLDNVGVYGGTYRHLGGTTPGWEGLGFTEYMRMFRGDLDFETILPSVAAGWELSPDYKELTIYLREGLKWSDGHPFTADDIVFTHEHVNLNPDLRPAGLTGWREGMQVIKVNDYEVRLVLQKPHPNILRDMCRLFGGQAWFYLPAHFMQQFHGAFADADQLAKWVDEAGVEHWSKLPIWGADWHNYPFLQAPTGERMPTLDPYIVVEETTEYRRAMRNPYFWMVDTEGNQLPYIDWFESIAVADDEVRIGKVIAGEADYFGGTLRDYSLYLDHAERGNYRVLLYPELFASVPGSIQFNQTYAGDPFLGELFRNPQFRQAISLAINRSEINEMLYFGLAEPAQATVLPVSQYYKEEYAKAFVEFDPDRANAMLDELGLASRDAAGYRLRPDGQRLAIMFEVPSASPVDELLVEQLRDVGIEILYYVRGGEIYPRAADNDVQMWRWMLDKMTDVLFPYDIHAGGFFVPVYWSAGWNVEGVWATDWARWYTTKGAEGTEPPAEYRELIEAWETATTTLSDAERRSAVDKILSFQAENLVQIGLVRLPPKPMIVHNRLRNVPEESYAVIWDTAWMYPYYPMQWYIEE